MTVRRSSRRFKHINEALGHINQIESLNQRLDDLKLFIGETPCALCGQRTGLESFCFGCLDFTCPTCSPAEPGLIVSGPHTLDDHREIKAGLKVGGL